MTPEKRAQQIEKAAIRAAQKAHRRHPEQPVSRDELLHLRIQTAPLWMRLTLIIIGLALCVGGGIAASNSSYAEAAVLLAIGLPFLVIGMIGRRKTIEACLSELGSNGGTILEAILSSFDGI